MMLYGIPPSEVHQENGSVTFSSTQIPKYCFPKDDGRGSNRFPNQVRFQHPFGVSTFLHETQPVGLPNSVNLSLSIHYPGTSEN